MLPGTLCMSSQKHLSTPKNCPGVMPGSTGLCQGSSRCDETSQHTRQPGGLELIILFGCCSNAAATIRIHPGNSILEDSAVFDPLDDSRIHPLQYPAAIQIAHAAMGRLGDEDAAVDQLQTRRRDVERVDLEVLLSLLLSGRGSCSCFEQMCKWHSWRGSCSDVQL